MPSSDLSRGLLSFLIHPLPHLLLSHVETLGNVPNEIAYQQPVAAITAASLARMEMTDHIVRPFFLEHDHQWCFDLH